ncbi:uncharacterized protein [Asterias amurensis]|uniref:uncharacterized protein n=1 Tax=Asterias amurensis TaxID=7602 RepID=UPI003AB1FA1D
MASILHRLGLLRLCTTASTTIPCRLRSSVPNTTLPVVPPDAKDTQVDHHSNPNQTPGTCKIRKLHPREVSILSGSQPVEGARLRNDDLRLMYNADPNGFFLATTENGDVVGTIAAVRQSETLGFIGFHHVAEAFQVEGAKLWETAMEYLGDRNVGIEVGTPDIGKYTELGFKEQWRTGCFKGTGIPLLPEVQSNKLLRPIADIGYGRVVDFDTDICGVPRIKFLLSWLQNLGPSAAAQAVLEGNRVIGFGVIRPLQAASSHRIGPLLAENAAATQVILLSLLSKIAKETLFIDSPLCNPSFTRILETDLKMEQVDERARMYSRGNPGVEVRKMFGVLSKDIG